MGGCARLIMLWAGQGRWGGAWHVGGAGAWGEEPGAGAVPGVGGEGPGEWAGQRLSPATAPREEIL